MARLIRMDGTGHTTLAEWTAAGRRRLRGRGRRSSAASSSSATSAPCRTGPGKATHVRELPREADLVIMRRPIAGG